MLLFGLVMTLSGGGEMQRAFMIKIEKIVNCHQFLKTGLFPVVQIGGRTDIIYVSMLLGRMLFSCLKAFYSTVSLKKTVLKLSSIYKIACK